MKFTWEGHRLYAYRTDPKKDGRQVWPWPSIRDQWWHNTTQLHVQGSPFRWMWP